MGNDAVHDANGNLTAKSTGTSTVRYYWDDEDKMVRLEDSVVMNFKTEGLGFRRYKEVVGQGGTYFVYDLAGSDTPGLAPLVAEYDQNGNLVAKYHHDGGLIAMTRGNQSYWHVFEAIGTTRQLVNAQTQVTDSYAYDAWGNELATQGSTVNPHRYVGKYGYYSDTQSALMLLGVRYYSAGVGRFWSLDPIKEGRNWYGYVANNPLGYTDPSGLDICPIPLGSHIKGPSIWDTKHVETSWELESAHLASLGAWAMYQFPCIPPLGAPCICHWVMKCKANRSIELRIEDQFLCFSHKPPFVYVGTRIRSQQVKMGFEWECGRTVTMGTVVSSNDPYNIDEPIPIACKCPYPSMGGSNPSFIRGR